MIIRYAVGVLILMYIWFTDRSGLCDAWYKITGRTEVLEVIEEARPRDDRVSEMFRSIGLLLVAIFIVFGFRYRWIPVAIVSLPFILFTYLFIFNPKRHTALYATHMDKKGKERVPVLVKLTSISIIPFFLSRSDPIWTVEHVMFALILGGTCLGLSLLRWHNNFKDIPSSQDIGLTIALNVLMFTIPIIVCGFCWVKTVNENVQVEVVDVKETKVIRTDASITGHFFYIPKKDAFKGNYCMYGDRRTGDTVFIVVYRGGLGLYWDKDYDAKELPDDCIGYLEYNKKEKG